MTKFGDHREGSLEICGIGANKYHGGPISQTSRDISLTVVDGTHSSYQKDAPRDGARICGIVSQLPVCEGGREGRFWGVG